MYYGAIKSCDIANGEGVRVSLFVSGCRHACKNCFNPETWCFNYGTPYTEATTEQLLRLLEPSYIRGLTLIGGEPMEPENQPVRCRKRHLVLYRLCSGNRPADRQPLSVRCH